MTLPLLGRPQRGLVRPVGEIRTPVLLYDGECELCAAVVLFMLRHDRTGSLRFAALQSDAARDFLSIRGLRSDDFDSLVYVSDWSGRDRLPALLRTDGALAAASELGGFWAKMALLRTVPRWARDPLYRVIARSRRLVRGQTARKALLDPKWASRFLNQAGPQPGTV
jgi:predicted DCC family thiol-disulfide oxidoreductase YuxK